MTSKFYIKLKSNSFEKTFYFKKILSNLRLLANPENPKIENSNPEALPKKNLGFGFGSGSRPKPKPKNPPKKQIPNPNPKTLKNQTSNPKPKETKTKSSAQIRAFLDDISESR